MSETRFTLGDLSKHSVENLIETVQSLEVGILKHNLLPKQWKNPGVAGLYAY